MKSIHADSCGIELLDIAFAELVSMVNAIHLFCSRLAVQDRKYLITNQLHSMHHI